MKASESTLEFLKGEQTQFVIPFFQRPYVWEQVNWEQLLISLENKKTSHYLGQIIIKNNVEQNAMGFYTKMVIDGQQRITTISLLLRAIYDKVDASIQPNIEDRIFQMLFVRKDSIRPYDMTNRVPKLVPGYHDKDTFDSIIQNPSNIGTLDENSNIVKCYQYFANELTSTRAESLFKLLIRDDVNFVVKTELDSSDNEQAIFDSTNATGVVLTCADIIKNDLFMRLPEHSRLKLYKDSWEKTIDEKNEYEYWSSSYNARLNIENLLFAVSQIEKKSDENAIFNPENDNYEELAQKYKEYFNDTSTILVDFIKRLMKYATLYKKYLTIDITEKYKEDECIPRCMLSFNRLHAGTVLFPYLLDLLYKNTNDDGDFLPGCETTVVDELSKIERLLLRSSIAINAKILDSKEKPSYKNFNKRIAQVMTSGNINDLFTDNQLKTINDDSKIIEGLKNIDNNTASILLFLLNLKLVAKIGASCAVQEYAYNYELEHIMPQHFESTWGLPSVDVDGNPINASDQEDYRRNYVYQIGNMTIITPNANKKIKNFSIDIKMKGDTSKTTKSGIKKGFQGYEYFAGEPISSQFKTEVITNGYVWNESMIKKRTTQLTTDVLTYWS